MYTEAYKEWIEIFNDDLLEIWQKERRELQKTSMLLSALQKELKNVQTSVEVEVINIKQQLKYKDILVERKNSISPFNEDLEDNKKPPSTFDKENEYDSKLVKTVEVSENISHNETESPDLFRNILSQSPAKKQIKNAIIDLSLSDEDIIIDNGSPTIKRRRKQYNKNKIPPTQGYDVSSESKKSVNTPANMASHKNLIKANLFKTPTAKSDDNDMSVIENTPEIPTRKLQSNIKIGGKVSKKRLIGTRAGNATLTQMFGRTKRKLQLTTNKKYECDEDSDETHLEVTGENSKMGITDLLSYINKDETTKLAKVSRTIDSIDDEDTFYESNMDSSEEVDEFSKGAIFNETEIATSSEKPKVVPPEPEPIVRGKARKQLQGWTCEQCKNFYSTMKLSPEELKKKMDECSRHRYKYNPPSETLPGFWDLSIPPENPK